MSSAVSGISRVRSSQRGLHSCDSRYLIRHLPARARSNHKVTIKPEQDLTAAINKAIEWFVRLPPPSRPPAIANNSHSRNPTREGSLSDLGKSECVERLLSPTADARRQCHEGLLPANSGHYAVSDTGIP